MARSGSSTAPRRTTPKNPISQTEDRTAHYNIFGGNIGGPLFIPKVYNTNQAEDLLLLERRMAQDSDGRRHQTCRHSTRRIIPIAGQDLNYVLPDLLCASHMS